MQAPSLPEDFLMNESFVRYCLDTATPAEHSYWAVYQQQQPHLQSAMAQARDMALAMYQWGQQQEITAAQQQLQQLMQQAALPPVRPLHPVKRHWLAWSGVAAALALAAGAWWLAVRTQPVQWISLQAGTGKVTQFTLPDSSRLWLNSNSRLRYAKDFTHNRQIILDEGEMFCEVQYALQAPFSVTTASGLVVRDIGTAFSVKSYQALPEEQIKVTDGVVAVQQALQQLPLQLRKGSGLAVNRQTGKTTTEAVQQGDTEWINGRVMLNNVTFREFLLVLENHYGMPVRVSDAAVLNCRISASFSAGEPIQQLLDNLKLIYGIDYTIHQNQIRLHGKKCN
ncbi:ferric-dicitrate binding protein FerR (iron transport regulator) [Filimonas zeae]|uniref:FecR family protein n=1 Tax=Filimonas zeae TaxID=1737353 RepID=A0A917MV23_9BACT|nr:FecR domain-containing protein [Filimonas zeae]MDR6338934.1 ferric-dicitrate binding protein FerR (iron transport regulator) [Filimonas zeae]GGH65886.1 hypothetical protein GCM10011379_19500 [Filimonas zeae]